MAKRIFGILGLLIAIGLVVFLYGGWKMFGDELRAIKTLKMVQERVYTFEYRGDYGFKAFLDQGGAKSDGEMAEYIANFLSKGYIKTNVQNPDGGCSSIAADGLFCRNFDWDAPSHYVVIKTYPNDGYASISTTGFAFLGMGEEWHPIAGMDGMTALAAIYIPMDGMNEMGLCVADLVEIDGTTEVPDTEKPDLSIVAAIRLLLDYAKDTAEAVRILAQYDVFPSANAAHHLAISDKNNKSIVVEWHRGQMVVTDTDVVTNHCIAQEREHPLTDNSRERFATLAAAQADVTTSEKAHNALKEVSFEEQTRWSVVYDKTNLMATICFDCDWDNPLIFNIAE